MRFGRITSDSSDSGDAPGPPVVTGSSDSSDSSSSGFPRPLLITLVAGVVGLATLAAVLAARPFAPDTEIRGLPDSGTFNAETVSTVDLSVHGTRLDGAEITLNGEPVETRTAGDGLALDLPELSDGRYELRITHGGSNPFTSRNVEKAFEVHTSPPGLSVDPAEAAGPTGSVTITGTAPGAAELSVAGQAAPLGPDGSFQVPVADPGMRVEVAATDEAGNTATESIDIAVRRPLMRAAHLSAIGWTSDGLREPILELVREGKLTAVQLDIKDESGEIGYDSQVPLAREIGAVKGHYDARQAIKEIQEAGGEVIGRIVAFRDPVLAKASWESGDRDRVAQTSDGQPYGGSTNYGALSFTNFAHPEVRQYHIDLAAEAAELGFDDILYDYIRRPDGKLSAQVFPGLGDRTPEESIVDFTADTRAVVREHGAFLGVSVYGIAATRPTEIGQDIPGLAEHADYIAPMIYPSHWAAGEYGVSSPNTQPYDITHRSLADFAKITEGTHVEIVPWLQDFSMGVSYGAKEVSEQIRGAADNGMESFLLWNAGARYHGEALPSIE
ncbi:putative glycoside hydrolase [Streptomyces sp. ACA25]|uniref:putative glycoside hydrolase n=1 Tax=Streptomyces sp. ACA25 TaxID=3022596 RepID=UPI0023073D68|nr:putative glycoside hydrolase [Streptomyces sp. ACA25]MDB1087944.1 putative glycoside hydrolase [Streptomyces sp. ACA25]